MRIIRWETNSKEEIIGVYDVEPLRTLVAQTTPQPLSSGEIVFLLNQAFESGKVAKAEGIKGVLGL